VGQAQSSHARGSRPIVPLNLFDRLVVLCETFALDIDLFPFDPARRFVGLF
jgi:hypothetical protein